MSKPSAPPAPNDAMMNTLSVLLISQDSVAQHTSLTTSLRELNREDFDALLALAHRNHVVVRAMEIYRDLMLAAQDQVRAEWAATAVSEELDRISKATSFLRLICDAFDEANLDLTVIKSLDHWPDFGSDIDLYTNAPAPAVCALMAKRFDAHLDARSWGDRLASKWNFLIPGLPESVEVHSGRLGQTGEQLILASRLPGRSRQLQYDGQSFRVASVSDRLMISTLQRMYRHFYFRLCDIIDSASLADSGQINYDDLQSSAQAAGIWEGVATYLVLVSDYVQRFRGTGLPLPAFVKEAARFGGETMYVGGGFLRVPIMPQAAGLYSSQFAGLLLRRELESSARLGLLPMLATAAAIGHKITGSDKGIW
jgi:hypothetical protein